MARLKKRLCIAALAALGGALLASCASGSEAPAGIYGNPPPVEDYLDNLGEFGPFVELIAERRPTKAEYQAIVDRYHESGMVGLGDDDRRVPLAVSQMAFLSHQRTLRYSLVARGTAPSDGAVFQGEAMLEEVYAMWNELQVIVARQVTARAIEWRRSLPEYNPDAASEQREIYEVPPESSEVVTSEVWDRSPEGWKCTEQTSEGGYYGLLGLVHEGQFSHLAKGTLLAKDTIDQRPAYRLVLREDSGQFVPEITYWLDAETLWIRQYEYEEDGIRYTVKLEAVNEDFTIEPPDVDVECVEEE